LSTQKILLADDSKTIQKVISLTFADAGFEVTSVGDGDSAMEKLAEFTPDLVMADVKMPGLNGYEVCERIKRNESTRHIPVILLVGAFEPFDADEAKRVGAEDHMTKPFQSIHELSAKVNDLINADGKELETADGNFDNTLEFEKQNLGDGGMDDAMIKADAVDDYKDEAETSEKDTPVELDEANLLELPPRDYFLSTITSEPFLPAETGSTAEAPALETSETTDVEPVETEESEVSDKAAYSADLSPEMIDAIAAKVVEKISDQVIREIAWEVVPQMTDLIVKRLAEEKSED
jgi:CheY-like chemotaxis protein